MRKLHQRRHRQRRQSEATSYRHFAYPVRNPLTVTREDRSSDRYEAWDTYTVATQNYSHAVRRKQRREMKDFLSTLVSAVIISNDATKMAAQQIL
jgi:hypothetical protein